MEENQVSAPDSCSDETVSSTIHKDLCNFNGFQTTRVLSENTQAKTITVLGNFTDKDGHAIVLLQKKCFVVDQLPTLLTGSTSLKKEFDNDIYGGYECLPPPELNGISTTIIHPATEKHIKKYEAKPSHAIDETPELYSSVTLPHLKEEQFNLQWVYNIIDGTAEQERVVYRSPSQEDKDGFLLVPDLKWDGVTLENLHLLALPFARGILSLRDLRSNHVSLLKNIYYRGKEVIEEKYGLPGSRLRIFFHYQPSFFHLHVHFTCISHEAFGINAGKAHLLSSVISNIEVYPNYYKDITLPFFLKESDNLFLKFEKNGKCKNYINDISLLVHDTPK
ncbi:hypothetical protein J437_LFUL007322 [Ladona fulva]|uniref:m7GpppX diphosphatase n=1 Tax=Ladona fulva TaxID=123851 RepID=A0A8K0K812_LADFU|nr:hypothetical protein J437_LFUL007322 [Ladona fulva]